MSEQQNYGFGKFVPGFDFLQNLSKGSSQTQAGMPNLSNWVAPTLNLDELDKRISELKAVHFWLDQNSRALSATIQALELQKMTLATLKGMNFDMADLANALKLKPADADGKPADPSHSVADAATAAVAKSRAATKNGQDTKGATGVVDPMQWWGALTQQFQEIAADAMKEAAKNPAMQASVSAAAGKPGAEPARKAAPAAKATPAAKKTAARKSVARKG